MQNYSGQPDDSIVSSEKLLLTFTKVGNKAGKHNDIFDQGHEDDRRYGGEDGRRRSPSTRCSWARR